MLVKIAERHYPIVIDAELKAKSPSLTIVVIG